MKTDIVLFAAVEDEPSRETLIKIVDFVNEMENGSDPSLPRLAFEKGTPWVAHGYGDIKTKHLPAMRKMAESNGICSIVLADLDTEECALSLMRQWLSLKNDAPVAVHPKLIFRIAVRETEAWLMADRKKFARFMGMPIVNVPNNPDDLRNPKKKIFEFISQYCKKQRYRMLPSSGSHIGDDYNPSLCRFIQDHWRPNVAASCSDSLNRAILALRVLVNPQRGFSHKRRSVP